MANYKAGNIYIDIQAQQQKAVQGIKETIAQLKTLKTTIKTTQQVNQTISKSLNSLKKSQSALSKANNITNKLNKSASQTSKSFDKMFSFGKLYVFLNYAKRIAQVFVSIVSSAIDFNETLNKFEVAMGDNYERALGFVSSLTKAFNLSTQSIMDYQSTFMNMLSALEGLNEDTSYLLSETLTRMGIDFASLFNVSVDRAMSMFQSALSGQVRAIRSISGYDITQSTYYALYQSMGGEKSVRQLTMIEKRLLVILAIQKQMEKTGAIGDFEKTINYTANELKQLSETFKEITMYIGQFTLYYIKPLVEEVLGFAIAVRDVLAELYDSSTKKVIEENVEGTKKEFTDLNEELKELTESSESAKKSLLGFDKLNVLGGTSSDMLGSDVDLIVSQLGKYNSSLDDIQSKSKEIAKTISTWFKTSDTIREIQLSFKEISNSVDSISKSIDNIFGDKVNIKWGDILLEPFNKIIGYIRDFIKAISTFFDALELEISQLQDSIKVIENFFKTSPIFTKEYWQNLFSWENIFDGINDRIEGFINKYISYINKFIDVANKINKVLGAGELEHIGYINIDSYSNTPMVDNNAYSNNSQNDMNAYGEMTNMLGGVTMPITNAILEAINNNTKAVIQSGNTTIEVNGKKLAEATYGDYQEVATRKGGNSKLAFEKG